MERKGGTLPRRKVPTTQVRQTVASMMRMVRANPLILESNKGTIDCSADELRRKLPARIQDPFGFRRSSDFHKKVKENKTFGRPSVPIMTNIKAKNNDIHHVTFSAVEEGSKPDVFRKPAVPLPPNEQVTRIHKPALMRKSSSAENVYPNSLLPMTCTVTQSMESLKSVSPINSSRYTIKTPSRSTNVWYSTPKNPKTPSLKELNARLNIWLVKRNKLPTAFKHLKTIENQKIDIAMHKVIEEEDRIDKENISAALNIDQAQKGTDALDYINIEVLTEALKELNELIHEGYDPEHCHFWLKKIKQWYSNVEDLSQFWECRAALEQASDNVNEAIECYKAAIIQGAEIQGIDQALDKLFEKFGALHLGDTMNYTPTTKSQINNRNVFYNQFKSTIIQFAVLKKNTKNMEKLTVITPVRRSSRLSHIRTPKLRVSSNVKKFNENEEIKFENNNHLSVRYS